jgi:hypothetical protein
MMVGRELLSVKHESDKQSQIKLEVKNLCGEGFQNVSFNYIRVKLLV